MAEPNPYQSPQIHEEQPQRRNRFGFRELLGVALWLCWIIGLIGGIVFAIHVIAR